MNTYKRHRFSPDIISYTVWRYYRFNVSHRDIEGLFAERGITVSHESIRFLDKILEKVFRVYPSGNEARQILLVFPMRGARRQ